MRKFIIFAMFATVAILVCSCSGKKENTMPLTDNLVTIEKNGKPGVHNTESASVIAAEYESIEFDQATGIITAKVGDATTLFTTSGYQLLSDNVDKILPVGPGFFRVSAADNVYLINPSTNSAWGKFDDIRVEGDFLFFKDEEGWGAATISHKGLAPRRFDNVYIVKSKTNFGVLVKNRDGWALYDSNGVSDGIQYDLAPKELAKQVKKLKLPETPYGLIEVNWDL